MGGEVIGKAGLLELGIPVGHLEQVLGVEYLEFHGGDDVLLELLVGVVEVEALDYDAQRVKVLDDLLNCL